MWASRAQILDDLKRQLARGREHERGGPRVAVAQALDERHAEGKRLARAGGRLGEHVVAGEHVGNDHALHGERREDAAPGKLA